MRTLLLNRCLLALSRSHALTRGPLLASLLLAAGPLAQPIAAAAEADKTAPAESAEAISFSRQVLPIFRQHCQGCHQPAKRGGDYLMTDFASLVAGGETGEPAIVPGKPDESYLIAQVTPVDGEAAMPQDRPPLSEAELQILRHWVAQGAVDDSPQQTGPVIDADHPPVYHRAPAVTALDISPDGSLVAVSGFHEVLLIDAATGERKARLVGLSQRINSIRFAPDGQRLAVGGGTPARAGEIQVWDVAAGQLQLSVPVTYDTLSGVSWSPDGTKIAFGCVDNTVRAIDASTGQQVLFQGAHDDWVHDTVFTVDGSHLVSVGRDMTCKLTEVATERFVDNVTSITPGALSGGIHSVARHPQRDEILVGGADGVPKIYRVFRQTARKIGDDANLLRRLPEMNGRIFSVAISPDGSRLAAAATVDGTAEVRVWAYNLTGEVPAEIQAIEAKRLSDRKPEEIQQLEEYRAAKLEEVARMDLPEASVYAIAFAPDNRLAVGSSDGAVRMLAAADGRLAALWQPAPVTESQRQPVAQFDPQRWAQAVAEQVEQSADAAAESGPPASAVAELIVQPAEIVLNGPYAYTQLLVTAKLHSGDLVDVTRVVDLQAPAQVVAVEPGGLLRPLADGSGQLRVSLGDHVQQVAVRASGLNADGAAVDFVRDVAPVLSRLGCNQGTCHGAAKGKNGFRLSLRGYDPIFDVRALSDDLAGRRLNVASPDNSLMLQKPLGVVPHEGGTLISTSDPYHAVLRRWIADGARLDRSTPKVERIELLPQNPVIQQLGSRQQVRVVAWYVDGTQRDVTRQAFVESGNTEVATVDPQGVLTAVRRGEAPILARYEGAYAATTLTAMGDRQGFEQQWQKPETWGHIDELVAEKWLRMKLLPSDLCRDEEFIRRVTLDLTGLPPSADAVRAFLADERPTRLKRAELIDQLIGNPDFIEYWTNKWADLLQVNSKFLGDEGAKLFHGWIQQAVAENRPYDQFAKQILTASGSNKDQPAASYFKVLRTAEETMENTTHLFLGIRFNCNKCHDHPFERWTQDQYYQTAAFFSQVALEPDPASGNRKIGGTAVEGAKPLFEMVKDADKGEMIHQRTGLPVEPEFPFACDHADPGDEASRRERLAAWMTSADNPYFARSYVNRLWGYLTGVGLIEPLDDIRAGNPPTNPQLLDHLTAEFIDSGFDVRHVMRLICNSRTYQLSFETNRWNEDDRQNYSHAIPRRLPAEVLYDAVHFVTGADSNIPGVPAGTRAASLTDAAAQLPDGFLATLGRPVRESACECERATGLQLGPVMALVSGPTVGRAISDDGNDLESLVRRLKDDDALVEELFLRVLSRHPSDAEKQAFAAVIQQIGDDHQLLQQRLDERQAWWDDQRAKLEEQRVADLAAAETQLVELQQAIEPEVQQRQQQRDAAIATAEAELQKAQQALTERIATWQREQAEATAEWFLLQPAELKASNGAKLRRTADRTIMAEGNKDKGIYTVVIRTQLSGITGLRLEALPAELPGGGPGLAGNGNFVVTELEVTAAPLSDPAAAKPVRLTGAEANFSQDGFGPDQAIDGSNKDQRGWAVSPAGGTVHWAKFETAEPISHDGGTLLTIQLHQQHNAADHRLARFRISATTDARPIKLGLPEAFLATASTAADQQSEAEQQLIATYFEKTDDQLRKHRDALAAASAPLPEDARVTELKQRIEGLRQPTPDDPQLVQLRSDLQQSELQMKDLRLTAAEDLTWALINSPAFLFNR